MHDQHAQQSAMNEGHRANDEAMREPGAMMAEHYAMARWVQPILMILGAWLIASPAALGYDDAPMMWSDIVSGMLVIALAALALSPKRAWAGYANAFVGAWLLFAPLAFFGRRRPVPT